MKEAQPVKEVILRGVDVNTILVSGFQTKGYIKPKDWEIYSMFIYVTIEEGQRTVTLKFYKKGSEPKVEAPPGPVKKEGNVLYFPKRV